MTNLFSLDIETKSTKQNMIQHAGLEPYRVRQGNAIITSVDLTRPDGSNVSIENDDSNNFKRKLTHLLAEIKGQPVYGHNTQFDIAFMIATLQPDRCGDIPQVIKDIRWRDTMLLTKWLINGQLAEHSHFSYSLANLVKVFIPEHPRCQEFLEMKSKNVMAGQDAEYWKARGTLDTIMTQALAIKLESKLPADQRMGLLTEYSCLVPISNSWLMGIKVNQDKLDLAGKTYDERMLRLSKELGLAPTVITSSKQLGKLLFSDWGLKAVRHTPGGAPGSSKEDLMWLQYRLLQSGDDVLAEKVGKILEFKSTATLKSKYVKSAYEALEHTGDGYIYGSPRIFATYTGRMSYSSTTMSKDFETEKNSKFKNGIALHQMPRKAKEIREYLEPPEGQAIYEADASGQESRLMALRSGDPTMLKVFRDNLNFHAMTGASIIGVDYNEFMEKYKAQEDEGGYFVEQRQLGKLANLSCNYRIGGKALSEKSFINYDTYMSIDTGNYVVKAFNRAYPKVPEYWEDVVWESKQSGYTEAFGGRRFKLSDWKTHRWMTESSAINVPIQGAGASMKEIAIVETYKKVDDAKFCLDLHDASFFYVPIDKLAEKSKELDSILNSIDYEPYWGFKPSIPLPYESKFGDNFSKVK